MIFQKFKNLIKNTLWRIIMADAVNITTVIKKCGCKSNPSLASEYQDAKYGQNMRVCNLEQDKKSCTCTVCGKKFSMS